VCPRCKPLYLETLAKNKKVNTQSLVGTDGAESDCDDGSETMSGEKSAGSAKSDTSDGGGGEWQTVPGSRRKSKRAAKVVALTPAQKKKLARASPKDGAHSSIRTDGCLDSRGSKQLTPAPARAQKRNPAPSAEGTPMQSSLETDGFIS
jgi:hypothetical protein